MRQLIKINSILLLLLIYLPTLAARTHEDALRCAQTFFASPTLTPNIRKAAPVSLHPAATFLRTNQAEPAFYAFNRGENEGYVFIAANEAVPAVIGYSDSGMIDENNMPDNLKGWLNNYQRELDWLEEHPEDALTSNEQAERAADQGSVAPLLGNIKWNQSAPYNNLCPEYTTGKRASAGCVATAVAQVMKYYGYPEKGIGERSYTTKTLKLNLSANFDTTYQWSSMKTSYTSSYTTQQASAVALLLYHVGVACNMNYGSNGSASSAHPNIAGYALKTYFKYDKSIRICYRDYYGGNWDQLIRSELLSNRPVVYTGYSATGGGHSFVCDGVNEQGYFHFNWGWGGSSNGYFLLTILNPSNQGIGGTGSSYCYSQNALVSIKPDKGGATPEIAKYSYKDFTANKTSFGKSEDVTFTVNYLVNSSVDTAKLNNVSILFMQNSIVKYTIQLSTGTTSPSSLYNNLTKKCNTSTMTSGTYDVALGYKESGYEKWRLINGRGGATYQFTLVVTDSKRTLTRNQKSNCMPEFRDVLYSDYLVSGQEATIKPLVYLAAEYHNYRDSMHLVMKNISTKAIGYDSKAYYVDLTAGTYDSTAITIAKLPAAGDYRVYLSYSGRMDSLIAPIRIYAERPADLPYRKEAHTPLKKILKDGHVLILKDGKIYHADGSEVR